MEAFFGAEGDSDVEELNEPVSETELTPEEIRNNNLFKWVEDNNVSKLASILEEEETASPEDQFPFHLLRGPQRNTLLHVAARHGHEQVIKLLLDHYEQQDIDSVDVLNLYNREGFTPLHLSVLYTHFNATSTLLSISEYFPHKKHPLECRSTNSVYDGMTALHMASLKNSPSILHLLLVHLKKNHDLHSKSLINWKCEEQRTSLHVACNNNPSSSKFTVDQYPLLQHSSNPLIRSVLDIDTEIDESLLLTLLHIECGSSLEVKDDRGYTPLILAINKGNIALVNYFIHDCKVDINDPDSEGNTPFHHAFQVQLQKLFNGNWTIMPLYQSIAYSLARMSCDIHAKNIDDITALEYSSPELKAVFEQLSKGTMEWKSMLPMDFSTFLVLFSEQSIAQFIPHREKILQDLNADEKKIFFENCPKVAKQQADAIEMDSTRGGCTFISSRTRGKPTDMPSDAKSACPFMKNNPDADPSDASKCPFMSNNGGSAPTVDSKAKSIIPFYQEFRDPTTWIVCAVLAGILAFATYRQSWKSISS